MMFSETVSDLESGSGNKNTDDEDTCKNWNFLHDR